MINTKDKTQCCGCEACFNVCPEHCIDMVPDKDGFYYPSVREESCISCHLCEKVCQFYNVYDVGGYTPIICAARQEMMKLGEIVHQEVFSPY